MVVLHTFTNVVCLCGGVLSTSLMSKISHNLQVFLCDDALLNDPGASGVNNHRLSAVRANWTSRVRNKLRSITSLEDDAKIRGLLGPKYLSRVLKLVIDEHVWSPHVIDYPQVHQKVI